MGEIVSVGAPGMFLKFMESEITPPVDVSCRHEVAVERRCPGNRSSCEVLSPSCCFQPLTPAGLQACPPHAHVQAHTLTPLQSKTVGKRGHYAFIHVSAEIQNFKKFVSFLNVFKLEIYSIVSYVTGSKIWLYCSHVLETGSGGNFYLRSNISRRQRFCF